MIRVSRFAERNGKNKNKLRRGVILPVKAIQADGKEVFIHPASALCRRLPDVLTNSASPSAFIVFHKKVVVILFVLDLRLMNCTALSSVDAVTQNLSVRLFRCAADSNAIIRR